MPDMNYEFEQFFNRDGFNRSLGHFKAVSNLLEDFEDQDHLMMHIKGIPHEY